jgi:hypothetical protein
MGWRIVCSIAFALLAVGSRAAAAQDSIAVVLADQVQMRDVPTITGVVRAVLLRGDTVKVKRREGYWVMVEFATREGFIRSAQLTDLFVIGGAPPTPTTTPPVPAAPPPYTIVDAPSARPAAPSPSSPKPVAKAEPKKSPKAAPRSAKPTTAAAEQATTPADSQRVMSIPPVFGNPSKRVRMETPVATAAAEPVPDSAPPRSRLRFEAAYIRQSIKVASAVQSGTTVAPSPYQPVGVQTGNGLDVQLRANAGLMSIGAGYVQTRHGSIGGDREVWSGPFVEPRVDWAPFRKLDVLIGLRAGWLTGAFQRDTTVGESRGQTEFLTRATQWTGVFGVRHHVRDRLAIELQAGIGVVPVSKTEVRTIRTTAGQRIEQRAITNVGQSGDIRQLRIGISLGF